MIDNATLTTLMERGFFALPRIHADSPGLSGLMVLLKDNGDEPNVAPDAVSVWVAQGEQSCHHNRLTPTSVHPTTQTLCPGGVLAEKHHITAARFFVFGGELDVTPTAVGPVLTLRSSAPILAQLNRYDDSVVDRLVAEIEVLLAEWRSPHDWSEQGARLHLTRIEPETLYLTCLRSVLKKFDQHLSMHSAERALYAVLKREKDWYGQQGKWHTAADSLDALL